MIPVPGVGFVATKVPPISVVGDDRRPDTSETGAQPEDCMTFLHLSVRRRG